jgi:hypothetical protein
LILKCASILDTLFHSAVMSAESTSKPTDIRGFNSIIHSSSCGYPWIQQQNPLNILWISVDSRTKSTSIILWILYHKSQLACFASPSTFHLIIVLNLLKIKTNIKHTSPILWVSKQANQQRF